MHAAVVNKFNEIATVFICNVWHGKYMAFFCYLLTVLFSKN